MRDLLQPFSAFDFAKRDAIVVAVSGGSDSTALLELLKRYLDRNGSAARLVAATVDHGLRPGSAAEAQMAAAFAATLGVAHRTIAWMGDKPVTGLPAAAREARYRLLAAVAADAHAGVIVTGHTRDDQAETVAMRSARGDGRGLAGMAPATLYDNRIWIARPLLSTDRATLRDHLRRHGIGWVDDPTNADSTFERPRIRLRLAGEDDRAPGSAHLLDKSQRAAAERLALGERAAALIAIHANRAAPGLFRLSPGFLDDPDRDAAVYALRLLLAAIGGAAHLPDEARARKLASNLATPGHRATLSRTMIASRRDSIFLCRERRGLPEPAGALHGEGWDGRFRLLRTGGAPEATIGPAGERTESPEAPDSDDVPRGMARIASSTLPRLGAAGSVPGSLPPEWSAVPVLSPWSRFLPSFDLAPAGALARLVGAPLPPGLPLAAEM